MEGDPKTKKVVETIQEGELLYQVDLTSYLDSGLFSDHRQTRQIIQRLASGKTFLNLFSYTGSFSVAASHGGALTTTSVDTSKNYLNWSQLNFRLNKIETKSNDHICDDVTTFINQSTDQWDIILLDPPTYSDRHGTWDVQRDHRQLIEKVFIRLKPGGTLFFSTNRQDFHPHLDNLNHANVTEISHKTVPIDYQRWPPHRCFEIKKVNKR